MMSKTVYWIFQYLNINIPVGNTLRPEQYGRHFTDGIFILISLDQTLFALTEISMAFVLKDQIECHHCFRHCLVFINQSIEIHSKLYIQYNFVASTYKWIFCGWSISHLKYVIEHTIFFNSYVFLCVKIYRLILEMWLTIIGKWANIWQTGFLFVCQQYSAFRNSKRKFGKPVVKMAPG